MIPNAIIKLASDTLLICLLTEESVNMVVYKGAVHLWTSNRTNVLFGEGTKIYGNSLLQVAIFFGEWPQSRSDFACQ